MSPQVNSLPHFPKVSGILAVRRIMYPGILPSTAGYLPFPTYPRSASTACILALLRFMYPGIHPLAPDVSPSPLTQGQPQQQPYSSSCIQESIRSLRMSSLPHFPKVGGAFPGSVSPGVHLCHLSGLPSPLPQSQRCLPRISVSRSPLMSPQVDSLPHFPKVSGILAVRRIMYPGILPFTAGYLPFPTYPRSASTACILALLRFMYPGIHPLAPDVSPSPLTQGQPQLHVFLPCSGSCIQESIRSLRMSPLPHLPKVSLNCMYSCLAQVHVSRNPSARSGCLPFPTYPRSASTTTFLKFMYPGIHPLAPDVFPSPFP
nr:uncharacterized protein LOC128705041 isoform X1 [Cherax quadricarinatus]